MQNNLFYFRFDSDVINISIYLRVDSLVGFNPPLRNFVTLWRTFMNTFSLFKLTIKQNIAVVYLSHQVLQLSQLSNWIWLTSKSITKYYATSKRVPELWTLLLYQTWNVSNSVVMHLTWDATVHFRRRSLSDGYTRV